MKTVLCGGILGGAILFIWSAVSWMVLPFHMNSLLKFSNEGAVESALVLNALHPGVYVLPNAGREASHAEQTASQGKMEKGPFAFVVMNPHGSGPMGVHFVISFLIQAAGAMLVTALLMKTGGMHYWGRVVFVVIFALAAGVIGHLPAWNWWGFSLEYTLAEFLDLIAGWFLAGLAIARIAR